MRMYFLSLLLALVLGGCVKKNGPKTQSNSCDKSLVLDVVNHYHKHYNAGEYEHVRALYVAKNNSSYEHLQAQLAADLYEIGELRKSRLVSFDVKSLQGGKTKEYTIVCKNTYQHCQATEIFVLIKEPNKEVVIKERQQAYL